MVVWAQTECKKTKQWQYLNLVVVPCHHEHFAGLLGSVAVLLLEVLITGSVLVPRLCGDEANVDGATKRYIL